MAASSSRSEDGGDGILEPLCFPERPSAGSGSAGLELLTCLFCSETFPLALKDVLLQHLLLQHRMVIADIRLIADLPRYLSYWRTRFLDQPITEFCSVFQTNSSGPIENRENYFLLCDVLPEDRLLREELQQRRLEGVLEQQQQEREDISFQRGCMFCSEEFTGNRSSLLNHMAREHSFSIGLPDNIVYCNDFLDVLQSKLDRLQCLYCEKTFRDKTTLKDHMRKKSHRRINAANRQYDRFYVINYLELGKTWEDVQSEDDRELVAADDGEDWSDWRANPVSAVCLFCEHQSDTMEQIYSHMTEVHSFDLQQLRTQLHLSFYQQVKLVNFIRRQIHQNRCYSCRDRFPSRDAVLHHLRAAGHATVLPAASAWDQPQYYFPTYENDALLCSLTDGDGEQSDGTCPGEDAPVLAEDDEHLRALKQNSVLRQLLKNRSCRS